MRHEVNVVLLQELGCNHPRSIFEHLINPSAGKRYSMKRALLLEVHAAHMNDHFS